MGIFKRRDQLSFTTKFLNFLWPSTGIKRSWAYIILRLARFPGSSYSIACGFACGAAISFTPFVGLHFIISAILAWLLRANVLASTIGTIVGNPWTFPFIWAWLYQTGTWITAGDSLNGGDNPKFSEIFGNILEASLSFDGTYLIETSKDIFWPMFVSSIPTSFMVWWLFYLPIKFAVQHYQNGRKKS